MFSSAENENPSESSENSKSFDEDPSKWGYDLYPQRKGEFTPSLGKVLLGLEGKEGIDKMKCERNVYKCLKTSKMVKLMLGALKSSGCEIDMGRHIVCEVCDPSVTGGYDPQMNQIVICQNNSRSEGLVQGILTHEMLHMFDFCNNQLDFKNVDHLACTEIRAANLCHCSLMGSILQGECSPFNIKQKHQVCVKNKALQSILAVRKNITKEQGMAAIERVFDRCYNDLEPIGRRVKGNSTDAKRAYVEGFFYGYDSEA